MNPTPERNLIGSWTGTYGTPGNERPIHLFLPADQVDQKPMRGRVETPDDGSQRARVTVMGDGAINIVLEGHGLLVCYQAQYVDGCVQGTRMLIGKRDGVPSVQRDPFVLRYVGAAQPPVGAAKVPDHLDAEVLGDNPGARDSSFTPFQIPYHAHPSGLWRGYFDDGEERVAIDVQLEFTRHFVRGTSEDATGERCTLEGIRLPVSGEVCWIAESRHDGRRWHWVGRAVDGGLEGEWWVQPG